MWVGGGGVDREGLSGRVQQPVVEGRWRGGGRLGLCCLQQSMGGGYFCGPTSPEGGVDDGGEIGSVLVVRWERW
jgi:hypothetical protein